MIKSLREELRELKLDILYQNSFQSVVLLIILAFFMAFFYRVEYGEVNYYPGVNSVWLPSAISVYLFKL
ncbi:MAG TPA: hypothetical protein PK293_07315, partial [Spirochaetota bacterium]|nr:hypothetical protein [Spirochaetota bacterium]HPF05831.1 hypothetical protein [Spirochaetota bacterium]